VDNIYNHAELQSDTTDLAVILDNPALHVTPNENFDPQLNSSSSKSMLFQLIQTYF